MKNQIKYILITLLTTLIACDNDVDLNAEFEDTTVVYSLINPNDAVQYVKVNRAYIEPNANAIDLAADYNNFNYENLDVRLINLDSNITIQLNDTILPKNSGIFSSESNRLYYTDQRIYPNQSYELIVKQEDGKVTSGRVKTLGETTITRPALLSISTQERRAVSMVDQRGQYIDYEFELRLNNLLSQAQISVNFYYDEEENGNTTTRVVQVPVGGISNPELLNESASIFYDGESFYRNLGSLVPDNGLKKVVQLRDNFELVITAVDREFSQYTQIYGPLDGLAQVRPEYSNVVNGVGLISSRSTTIVKSYLDDLSRNQLFNGPYTRGRGFSNP